MQKLAPAEIASLLRRIAERDEASEIKFSDELLNSKNPAAAEARVGQRKIFASRRTWLAGQVAILKQQIAQLTEEISALHQQVESETRQTGFSVPSAKGMQSRTSRQSWRDSSAGSSSMAGAPFRSSLAST